MRAVRLLSVVVLALAPALASAADVPVVYTVDSTALKLAISGTNLTFQLYTDAACTSLAHTQVLTVDNTNMLSVLKRSKPKNGVKPPKTTDIRATLTGVAPAAPLYLTVTGTGITAVGGACQVQASTATGPTIGKALVIRDANGTFVGSLDPGTGSAVIPDGSNLISGYVAPTGFTQASFFQYASANCTGPALVGAYPSAGGYLHTLAGVDGTTLYYAPLTGTLTTIASGDYAPEIPANCNAPQVFVPPNRCCCPSPTCTTTFPNTVAPPLTMDISAFVPPFAASLE
jgi:hypothetical protein